MTQEKSTSWIGLLLIVVAAITLEGTSLVQYYYSQKGLREEAALRAQREMERTEAKILNVVDQTESVLRNSVWIARWCLNNPDSLYSVCRRIVKHNPVIMGSTVALVPGYSKTHPLFSPYMYEKADGTLGRANLATPEYNYPSHEWFVKPLELGDGYWSEPYKDTGGGEILMTTYSLPVRDHSGRIAAIITADISLAWLGELLDDQNIYPGATSIILSRNGEVMVCPADSSITDRNIFDVVKDMPANDTAGFMRLNRSMLSGETGSMRIPVNKAKSVVYYDPVERTGWSMSIIIPESEIFGSLRRTSAMVLLMQLIGLVMLIIIMHTLFGSQKKARELQFKEQQMEGELNIARGIQMSMVPKIFPPFPERKDLDMAAAVIPAKEVGGDLYDYYIRDNKLFFCVGDVSGKGVPASLVMAVTRTAFRTISAKEDNPGRIIESMNHGICEMNESQMFVTVFCGVLDLENGHLYYCNAGHNPPIILTDAIREIPVESNLPLGILPDIEFKVQDIPFKYDDAIFLYTDGITEAENIDHDQFGEKRMMSLFHQRRSAQDHLAAMENAISQFVGDAPQSDDITMLFIHYLGVAPTIPGKVLVMHNDINQISRLEEWVGYVAMETGMDPLVVPGINLALEEAATNVILYAYPEGTYGCVELIADWDKESVTFILRDSGKPFDPTAREEPDITASAEDRPIGGLGIFLVKQIMDNVSYEYTRGMNILTMIKKL